MYSSGGSRDRREPELLDGPALQRGDHRCVDVSRSDRREPDARASRHRHDLGIFPGVEADLRQRKAYEGLRPAAGAAGGDFSSLELFDVFYFDPVCKAIGRRVVPRAEADDVAALLSQIKKSRRAGS